MYVLLLFKCMLIKLQLFAEQNANPHIIDTEFKVIIVLNHSLN